MTEFEFGYDARQHGGLDDEGEDLDNPGFLRFYQPPGEVVIWPASEDDDE